MEITYNEEDLEFNVIHSLNEYADKNPKFNSKFLDGVIEFYNCQKYVTLNQIKVLNEIYRKILKDIEES